jgi:hypothetical protein
MHCFTITWLLGFFTKFPDLLMLEESYKMNAVIILEGFHEDGQAKLKRVGRCKVLNNEE